MSVGGVGNPLVAMVFGSVGVPQSDVITVSVHFGCSKEVSSFEALLQNWDGKYSPNGAHPITVGSPGGIGICREPYNPNVSPVISVKVEGVQYESTPFENYIRVSGRCWGEKLFRQVVNKTYRNMKGEAIVKDLLDNYVGLSHVRGATELVENTDTTYTKLEYVDTPVWDILKYIAETSDTAGIIGYDFRVAPDGKFEFFAKNSKTNGVSLVESVESSRYRKDISRVRNKITVYGLADKSAPLDKDAWTESLSVADGAWSSAAGSVFVDSGSKARGNSSIKCTVQNNYFGSAMFILNSGREVNCNLYPTLSFFLAQKGFSGSVQLILFDSDGKGASKYMSIGADEKWHQSSLRVGSDAGDEFESVQEGFDWTHVKIVRIDCHFNSTGSGTFWVDGLFFGGRRYSAVREDSTSQSDYGLREYIEVDEELFSDNECDLRAKSLLAYLKSPAEYLTVQSTVIDYVTNPVLAGDKVSVALPNEGVSGFFRVESVEYNVDAKAQTLELIFELGKEPPQVADYLYGLRTFTVNVEKLARTKTGRVAGVSGGSGGGGGGYFGGEFTIPTEAASFTRQGLLDLIWGFENGVWQPQFQTIPLGTSYIRFYDKLSLNYVDLGIVTISESNNDPILTVSQGFVVKKDISCGGFLAANQGMLGLGSGMFAPYDQPMVWLMHSELSQLHNVERRDSAPSDPAYGQMYIDDNTDIVYRYLGSWVNLGSEDDFGLMDRLHIYRSNHATHANLECEHLYATSLGTQDEPIYYLDVTYLFIHAGEAYAILKAGADEEETYVYPENFVGLGTEAHPFEWINTKRIFIQAGETYSILSGGVSEDSPYNNYIFPDSSTGLGSAEHPFAWLNTQFLYIQSGATYSILSGGQSGSAPYYPYVFPNSPMGLGSDNHPFAWLDVNALYLFSAGGAAATVGFDGSWIVVNKGIVPNATNTYVLGHGGAYWNAVVAYTVYCHSVSQSLDALDDRRIIQNYKTKKATHPATNEELDIIDLDSIPEIKADSEDLADFIDFGKAMRLSLGAIKMIGSEMDSFDARLRKIEDNIKGPGQVKTDG
ncbi:MAG: hypothetical protein NWF01_07880 [Candidatus Bathyarchaeota archaeon]|nr:hypothetical protein [Candidatus Bathyarchaeota archaeon]